MKKVKSLQYEFLKYLNKYDKNREWYKIKDNSTYNHQTIVWLGEEVYKFKFDPTILLVEEGDFIPKGFELIPD